MLDLRVFEQATWWVDREGRAHAMTGMSVEYRQAVTAHLERHAATFHAAYARKQVIELAAEVLLGLPGSSIIALQAGDPAAAEVTPTAWLAATPLMRGLTRSR